MGTSTFRSDIMSWRKTLSLRFWAQLCSGAGGRGAQGGFDQRVAALHPCIHRPHH